ncbi:MAG: hypothetical protein KGK06_03085 [Xanthomonadaceae bacterium]|nr:hypothetical protein [Xanthomonadaceae bacterium]MDE2315368.1 hypothetical protein [Xanthomonadaceae bacterium]
MQDSIKRYFLIFVGIAGMLSSGVLIVASLRRGTVLSPIYAAAVAGVAYQRASQASPFWFVLLLYGAAFVGFAWIAWRAYRR